MNITKKEVEKLCDLYCWLNVFLHQLNQEQLQKLEDEYYKFRNRAAGLPRVQLELDTYHSLEYYYNKYPLSERQQTLKTNMMTKKIKDIEVHKANVCQFLLELDSIDKNISMTSHLYSAYPMVHKRLYEDLLFLFNHTNDKEAVRLIGKTLFDRKYLLYRLKKFISKSEIKKDTSKNLILKK